MPCSVYLAPAAIPALRGGELAIGFAGASAAAEPSACVNAGCDYRNEELGAERRAADLVGRLNLEEKAAQLDNSAPAVPRLGIAANNWWNEGLHGVARAGYATVFPQAIGIRARSSPARTGATF